MDESRDQPLPPPAAAAGEDEQPILITGDMLEPEVDADGREDFERGMSYAPPVTLALSAALVAVFVWQVASGGLKNLESIVASGALQRDLVLAGEPWRMITAAFLHGGFDHLLSNVISLYILGMACEHAFGGRGMLAVYGASAIGGSVVSMSTSAGPSVGASGAIFGLMGAAIVVLHRVRDRVVLRDKRIGVVIAGWAGFTLLSGALMPMVDNGAHLGGLVVGAVAAAGVKPVLEQRSAAGRLAA